MSKRKCKSAIFDYLKSTYSELPLSENLTSYQLCLKEYVIHLYNQNGFSATKTENFFLKDLVSANESQPQQIRILFPDLENNKAADIEDILFGDVIGRNICHMWYDSVTNTQEIYYGRTLRFKKNNIVVYIISYCKPKEREDEDANEFDMNKYQLSADMCIHVCDLALSDNTRSML
nr:uncharacterized protein LOC124812119 [Hydra vulgaris]